MPRRSLLPLAVLAALAALPATAMAQKRPRWPERAIRRDIPMTDMIRRAFAAGTRDSLGTPGPNYWQMWDDYTIRAGLDPATGVVTGHEHVVVQNPSDSVMRVVVLRLDQNLFSPNVPRAEKLPALTTGMQVTSLMFDGQPVDLNPPPRAMFFRRGAARPAPTLAAYDMDQTVATVTLPTPVPAHGSFTLDADWHFTVPAIPPHQRGERMGAWGDSLFQVAQWYPRVAKFDDLRQGGWDTEPYLGTSEFYDNFGRYDVRLVLPAGWVVGAGGVLQDSDRVLTAAERGRLAHALDADATLQVLSSGDFGAGKATAAGDSLVWHFVADTVRDFAWAASDRYQWDVTRAAIPGKGEVPVNILYLPGDSARFVDAGPTVRHALEFYSRLWIPYVYPQLTMVDGPEDGMEYPMFIMSGVGAADHETGHQWWPMTVNTNETWYPFMDEGFNQYMNILSAADREHQAPDLNGLGQAYGRISGDEQEAPMMWDANYGGPLYVFQAYIKPPMMLSMLGGVVGDTAVWKAMQAYAETWRFKSPSPWDFAFSMDHSLHQDLGWFWYYWLFTTDAVDGSISNVRRAGRATIVTVREDGQMPSPVVLGVHFAPTGPRIRPMKNARLVDDSTAVVTWPVDVWFAGSRTFQARLDFGPRKIERIVFDPYCRFPDNDPSDNVWPRSAAPAQAPPRGMRAMFGAPSCGQ